MKVTKRLLLLGALAAFCYAGWYWYTRTVHVTWGCCLEARFADLPADDEPLCRWLKAQPGVVPYLVSFSRGGPDGRLLKVGFTQTRNLAGEPPLPDLDAACARLGYRGPESRFRVCEDEETGMTPCK
jgi:hypothetical protein